MKQGQQIKVTFKKGKETSREPHKVKGEEVKNTIMDSVGLYLQRENDAKIAKAKSDAKAYEEVIIWDITDVKEVKPKRTRQAKKESIDE